MKLSIDFVISSMRAKGKIWPGIQSILECYLHSVDVKMRKVNVEMMRVNSSTSDFTFPDESQIEGFGRFSSNKLQYNKHRV